MLDKSGIEEIKSSLLKWDAALKGNVFVSYSDLIIAKIALLLVDIDEKITGDER